MTFAQKYATLSGIRTGSGSDRVASRIKPVCPQRRLSGTRTRSLPLPVLIPLRGLVTSRAKESVIASENLRVTSCRRLSESTQDETARLQLSTSGVEFP